MIVKHQPGGRALVDREALAAQTGLSPVTIRMKLKAVEYDEGTGRALYDHDSATEALEGITPWRAAQGKTRRRAA